MLQYLCGCNFNTFSCMRILTFFCLLFLPLFLAGQSFPAMELDGTSGYVKVPNPLNFGTTQDFSIEIKIKTQGWSGDPAIFSDKDWNAGANPGMVISGNTNGNTWKFNIGDGASRIDLNNGGVINDNEWHHLTVTFDRDGPKRIYQDGRLLQTNNTVFNGNVNGLSNLCFGQDGTTTYFTFFPGQIADVRVWNVALDSATVAGWICQPVTNNHPNYANLVHYWAFLEGAGASTLDLIGGALGALEGGATWATGELLPAEAQFTYNIAGQTLDFINTSLNATGYSWDFGNGTGSTQAEPSVNYSMPGTYTVRLVARNLCSVDTFQQSIYIAPGSASAATPGAGRALDFDGTNDYVLVPSNDALKTTTAITLEAWIKPRSFEQWESIISFAQDNGGNESGYDFSWVDGKLRFRCAVVNMPTNQWNGNPGAALIPDNEWVHVAGVYDGAQVRMYVNGVLIESQNRTGAIDWEFAPVDFRIGAFHDDNENYYYDGQIDEVRVWNTARSTEEIREAMCHKLAGNETGLVGYWRLDELVGNTTTNRTLNTLDGTLTNMSAASDRVLSGAAVGDASAYLYTNDWQASTAGIAVLIENLGIFGFNEVEGEPEGMHLYVVDSLVPTPGLIAPEYTIFDRGAHIGVFPTKRNASYQFGWDYTDNNDAVNNAPNLALLERYEPFVTDWSNIGATVNTIGNFTDPRRLYSHRQFLPVKSFDYACNWQGDGVTVAQSTFNAVTLNWTLDGGVTDIQWGPLGFNLGSGAVIDSITTDSITIGGLEATSLYDVYFYVTCGPNDVPGWYGPYTVSTLSCVAPANLLVDGVTSNSGTISWDALSGLAYDLQWGPAGFSLGIGIQTPNVSSPYTLNGLAPNKAYDVYIRTNCGPAGESAWFGPISFTTLTVGTGEPAAEAITVYPNPNNGAFFVEALWQTEAAWTIVDQSGRLVQQGRAQGDFQVTGLAAGCYVLTIRTEGKTWRAPLTIVH